MIGKRKMIFNEGMQAISK